MAETAVGRLPSAGKCGLPDALATTLWEVETTVGGDDVPAATMLHGNVLETTHQSTTRHGTIQVQYDQVRAGKLPSTSRLVPQQIEVRLGHTLYSY